MTIWKEMSIWMATKVQMKSDINVCKAPPTQHMYFEAGIQQTARWATK
jgi:hypothetical protein